MSSCIDLPFPKVDKLKIETKRLKVTVLVYNAYYQYHKSKQKDSKIILKDFINSSGCKEFGRKNRLNTVIYE